MQIASDELKSDKEIVLRAVKTGINWYKLDYIVSKLTNRTPCDIESLYNWVLKEMGESLKSDKEFLLKIYNLIYS